MTCHIVSVRMAAVGLAAGLSIVTGCGVAAFTDSNRSCETGEVPSANHPDKPWCNEFGGPNTGCHTPEPGSALIE